VSLIGVEHGSHLVNDMERLEAVDELTIEGTAVRMPSLRSQVTDTSTMPLPLGILPATQSAYRMQPGISVHSGSVMTTCSVTSDRGAPGFHRNSGIRERPGRSMN